MTTKTLTLPVLNINGTEREDLLMQVAEAYEALDNALGKLSQMAPHGRDYQTVSEDVFRAACKEHAARCDAVREIMEDLTTMAGAL
jgi:hypothetical protein